MDEDNAAVQKWIDAVVDLMEAQAKHTQFNDQIALQPTGRRFDFLEGIERAAKCLDVRLYLRVDDLDKCRYHYFFLYRGVEFCQEEEESLDVICF